VDESHYFKNLGIPVRTDGFSVAASKRATDLDMKLSWLRERGGGTIAALFTGTPVSNTLLEMYVLQHYLHPGRIEELGLASADAWAATFVEFQTAVEVSPDGASFRLKRRPAKFENVPELLTLFGEVADLRPPESFAVARPAARHQTVVIGSSPELRAYVASLAERADRLREVDAHDDNMLKICSDGRKAALDLELVGITAATPGKVAAVTANLARIYHATRHLALPGDDPAAPGGGFQIAFCDLGTPSPTAGAQVYGKIRAGLIEAGVPAGRIRFIHDASTDLHKAALFAECRAGQVSVLLGSTDKLGVGTNIQTRCVALHHVDAPWRPADVEQREGRALRPGNLNPSVEIYRYVSEKSFDSYLWQTLERKARFIGQVLGGRPSGRDVDDIGDATLSYAEVKALATGNPLLLDLADANAQVTRLRHLATAHVRATRRLENSVTSWQQQITAKTRLAGTCDRIAAAWQAHPGPAWHDHMGTVIPGCDVPASLARLARDAMASAGYGTVSWRGLHISFSAERKWQQIIPVATIRAGAASLPVELNAAWTVKGQPWRIEKEITSTASQTAAAAQRLRDEADDLRQRTADATRRIGEPFPQAAELEAARARRDAIEQAIREAAAPQDDLVLSQDSDPDLIGAPTLDAVAAAGLPDAEEPGVASVLPAAAVLSEQLQPIAIVPDRANQQTAAEADDVGVANALQLPTMRAVGGAERSAGEVAADPGRSGRRARSGDHETGHTAAALLREPGRVAGRGPQVQLPLPEAGRPAEAIPEKLAPAWQLAHPALTARLDYQAEPLFAVPMAAQEQPRIRHAPRARRATRRPSGRRQTAQTLARDGAAQLALFDLPSSPAPAPARRKAPSHDRITASRK
jgi:hypothetical protein